MPMQTGYKGELQLLVDNLTLKHLLSLAANPKNADNVRGEALLSITNLKYWLQSQLGNAKGKWMGSLDFALAQIDAFSKDPDKFVVEPALEMPPGAPIGMPDDEFEF